MKLDFNLNISPVIAKINEDVTFTYTVTNNTDKEATDVIIKSGLDNVRYNIITNSLKVNNEAKVGDIIAGLSLDPILPGDSRVISFTAHAAEHFNNALKTTGSLDFKYLEEDILQDVNKNTESISYIIDDNIHGLGYTYTCNKLDAHVGDNLQVRIIAINKGFRVTYDVAIKSQIPSQYQFLPETLKCNGKKITGDIEEGIYIGPLLQDEYIILTFELKAKAIADNLIEFANIIYTYLDEQGREITESLRSNSLVTSITAFLTPLLKIRKEYYKKVVVLNDKNHFDIFLYNDGKVKFTNVKLTDIVDAHYKIVPNSITINNISVEGDIEDLSLPNMNSGEFLVIGFNAKAVKTGLNIKNESFVSY